MLMYLRFWNGEIDHPVHQVEAQERDREDNPRIFVDVAGLHTKESFRGGLEVEQGRVDGDLLLQGHILLLQHRDQLLVRLVGREKLLAWNEGSGSDVPQQQQQKSPAITGEE